MPGGDTEGFRSQCRLAAGLGPPPYLFLRKSLMGACNKNHPKPKFHTGFRAQHKKPTRFCTLYTGSCGSRIRQRRNGARRSLRMEVPEVAAASYHARQALLVEDRQVPNVVCEEDALDFAEAGVKLDGERIADHECFDRRLHLAAFAGLLNF